MSESLTRKLIFILYFMILSLSAVCQSTPNYFLNGNREIILNPDHTTFAIRLFDADSTKVYNILSQIENATLKQIFPLSSTVLLNIKYTNVDSVANRLTELPNVICAYPGLKQLGKDESIWVNGVVNIQFKPNITIEDLGSLFVGSYTSSTRIIVGNDTITSLILNKTIDIFDYCNLANKSGKIVFAEPDFILPMHSYLSPDDDYYSEQWHLPQIDAPLAWDLSTGSSGVQVAIIDGSGYDLSHIDLDNNISNPYDAYQNNYNPIPLNAEANHGTPCIGIFGTETDNSTGVAGVAYNCKAVPINIGYGNSGNSFFTSPAIIALASSHIISLSNVVAVSNSYGGSILGDIYFAELSYSNMREQCRGGLGAVILASTGNDDDYNPLQYPASFPFVIGVGASDEQDERCSFSNWGDDIVDIAAPGEDIYTIDRTGNTGYTSIDYNSSFDGTSAACPIAAGIVGLMASLNGSLTVVELEEFLQVSCEKVGGYTYGNNSNKPYGTFSEEFGYGRVNAYQAVLAASGGGCTPQNDECLGFIELTVEPTCNPISGTVDCANPDGFPTQPSCDAITFDPDGVFYFFYAPFDGEVTIIVEPTIGNVIFDPVIVVYEDDCFSLDEVGCMDDNGEGELEIIALSGLTSNAMYTVRVYDFGNLVPYDGSFTICVTGSTNLCEIPANLDEDAIGEDYVELDWSSNGADVNYYEVRYRLTGGSWNYVYPTSSNTTINDLICNSDYEWEVRTYCDGGGVSNWTSTQYFTTDDCNDPCDEPTNLHEDAIGEDYADLDWNSVSNDDYYEVRYMESGGSWVYAIADGSYADISGLACNASYDWQVRCYCEGGGVSGWSSTESFTTDECPVDCDPPSNLVEDDIGEDYANLNWNDVSNINYYEIRYVDYLGNWIYGTSFTSSTTITNLICNSEYQWEVRTHCNGGETSSWTGTESFITDACVQPCDVPLNLHEDATGQDYADLDWNDVSNIDYYEIRYIQSGGSWIYVNSNTSDKTITGLDCSMEYEWEVRTHCIGGGASDWTGTEVLVTGDCDPLCEVPTNLVEGTIGTDYANLNWNNGSNADFYEIRYRISGGNWIYNTSTPSNIFIDELTCGSNYEWGARTHCNDGEISDWSSTQYFSTSDCGFPPGAPFLVYPINGQYDEGGNITFVWNSVSTATEYYFELSCLSNFDIVFDDSGNQGNNTSTSWSGFPKNGTIFFWRVKAGNAYGWGPWSDSFFINGNCSFINLPGPYLLAPEHNSGVTNTLIDFKWSQTSCDNYYWFDIADNPNFISPDYTNEMLYDQHITLELTAPNGSYIYYWRVASHNNFGWSYYSYTSIFTWILTAIDNTDNQGSLLIYPNPTDGVFNISFKNFKAGQYHAKVYSSIGQLVDSREIEINMVSHDEQFDLSMLSSGIYLIEIMNEIGGKEIAKIMIE